MDDLDLLASLLGYVPNSVRSGVEELVGQRDAIRARYEEAEQTFHLALDQRDEAFKTLDQERQTSAALRVIEPLELAALIERLKASEDELHRERMRLAACGVVAQANTRESAAKARDMHPDFRSASCDDVACAVDREMALREKARAHRSCGDARSFVLDIGPERGRQAAEAGRKFLGSIHQPEKVAFTREEVNLISMMEARHVAVEAVAAEVGMRK